MNDAHRRSLARLDIPTLIERADQYLDLADYEQAIAYLRTAVRRAPLRQDLRDHLFDALRRKVESGASAPRPIPRVTRGPLFESASREARADDDAFEFEAIETDAKSDQGHPTSASEPGTGATKRKPRAAGGRPRKKPSSLGRAVPRRRASAVRGPKLGRAAERHVPKSATALGSAFAFIAFAGLAAVVTWFYFDRTTSTERIAREHAAVGARRDQRLLESARQYEQENQFALAIEQLELLRDPPLRDRRLSEIYSRQGDFCTRNKRYNAARDAYQRALEKQPDNPGYVYDLGATLYMIGRQQQTIQRSEALERFDEAERYLKRAIELEASGPGVYEILARIENARGNAIGAQNYLRLIIERFGESREAANARTDLQSMGLKP